MALAPNRIVQRATRALLASVVIYYTLWGGEYSLFDLARLDEQARSERASLAEITAEVDSLRELATRLEDDPAAIERVARERFGMIRRGELLFRFIEAEPDAESGPPAPAPTRLTRGP